MLNPIGIVTSLWTARMQKQKVVTVSLIVIALSIILLAIEQGKVIHAVSYLMVVVVAAWVVDVLTARTHQPVPWKIKNIKAEVLLLLSVVALQWVATLGRFVWITDWNTAAKPIKLVLFAMMILFIYPVFLIIWYFFIKRYKPTDLGLSIHSKLVLAMPVIALIGITTYLVAPANIQFSQMLASHSMIQLILLGFVTAAIPEEFLRMLVQTRLGKMMNHVAWAWLITGILWAAIHIPNFGKQSDDWVNALRSALAILPLGLLWGYLTHRLQNLWPSVLIHGTNLWGLQNIF
jgi:membrane protease YdiL (CAAX protease family)